MSQLPEETVIDNNTSAAATVTIQAADLTVAKTATPDPVVAGQAVTFDIVVKNEGNAGSSSYTLTDVVPAQFTSVAYSGTPPSGCAVSGGTLTCTNQATLAAGATRSYKITAVAGVAGPYTNEAKLSATANEPTANNAGSVTGTIQTAEADLTVTKTSSATSVAQGGPVTFTITVTNSGNTPSSTYTLTDAVPAQFTGVATSTAGCTAAGNTVTCGGQPGLAAGASKTFTITANAGTTVGNYTNTATVSGTTNEPTGNNSGSVGVSITSSAPDYVVTKTASTPSLMVGQTVTWTVVVKNSGNATGGSYSLSDVVPAQFTNVALVGAPSGCSVGGQTVSCVSQPGLDAGASVTYTITAKAGSTLGSYENTASVPAVQGESSTTNNQGKSTVTIDAAGSIPGSWGTTTSSDGKYSLTKTASSYNLAAPGSVTYTYTIKSNYSSSRLYWTWLSWGYRTTYGKLVDDTCKSVTSPSLAAGWKQDGSSDWYIAPGTTATLTCTTNLAVTTTNTATLSGLQISDGYSRYGTAETLEAKATVVVAGSKPLIDPATLNLSLFTCQVPTVYDAYQNNPTILGAQTQGSTAFTTIGSPGSYTYNAIAYNEANQLIYVVTQRDTITTPRGTDEGQLGVLDSSGTLHLLGYLQLAPGYSTTSIPYGPVSLSGGLYTSVSNYGAAWENDVYGGINFGFFDAAGNYWIGNASTSGSGVIYQVDLRTGYVYPLAGQNAAVRSNDLAFAFGYAWGVKNDTNQFQRVNLATGAVETFAGTASMPAGTYGAAWTYGNGNLGFDINTGGVYQVQVLNPTTATPSFVLVAKSAGPASFNNDGTSCVGRPTDLSILKTLSSATVTAGGTATWNLTVKNEGTTASSGFTVTDIVPSTYTTVTATMPTGTGTCTVSGNTVTCVSSGVLQPGETRTITITAKAPASGCATNTARVVGNEDDPNPENDYSSAQTCVTGSAPATCDSVMYGSIDAGGSTSTYGSIGTAYPTLAKKQSIDLNSTYDSTSAISVSAFDANIVYYTARTPAGQSNFNHTLVAMNLATGIETVVNNSSPSAWDTNRLATAPDGTIWSLGDGGVLWSWNPADGNVAATNWGVPSVVDGDGKTISFGSLDSGDITFDGFGNLWVVGAYATNPKAVLATISATSLTTSNPVGSFVGYMTSPSTPANAYFNGLAFAPDGTLVASSTYVGTPNSSALWKVNPTTGETTAIQTGISSATYGYIADLGSCSFPKPNLSIEKSVSPSGPVQPGAVLTYTVVLRNTGQLGATGVQFMDELPSGVTYVPGSTTLNTTQLADTNGRVPFSDYRYVNGARATANNVGYIGGTADAPPTGDVATITFQVTVGTDYSAPQVCNTGTAMFADASHASIRSDNPVTPESGDPTCVAIARPTFGVQKSAAGGEPGGTGTAVRVSPDGKATVTYTVVVTNNGLLATKHPQIDDQLTLPTGFALDGQTPVVVTNANGAVVASSTTTSVTIPAGTADLAVGASATYTVTVTVKAANIATTDWTAAGNCNTHLGGTAASGGVFNVVSMTDDADGADNNDACVPILPPPSVTLLKTGPDGQVLTGATFQLYSPNATTPLGTPMTVGTDGKVTWQNLNPGTYWVKETVAPTGYALDTRTYGFTVGGDGTLTLAADNPANPSLGVSTDGQLLTFRNLHKLEYPAAGGVGSVPFAVIGLLLMALGAYRLRPRGAYMS